MTLHSDEREILSTHLDELRDQIDELNIELEAAREDYNSAPLTDKLGKKVKIDRLLQKKQELIPRWLEAIRVLDEIDQESTRIPKSVEQEEEPEQNLTLRLTSLTMAQSVYGPMTSNFVFDLADKYYNYLLNGTVPGKDESNA